MKEKSIKVKQDVPIQVEMKGDVMDNWKHRSQKMLCGCCMYFMSKVDKDSKITLLGRCRRNAPTMKGWPVMYTTDWCGDHKLDENKI